ncbi:serine hydrolase [Sphingomonas sp. AR_OL41]|uniref:serine hydrolase n=1 Tax=Sphingomonas sp. AR_OL41 TaxID=3042729 RepID=UPI00247FAF0D|nr:serine hydrolase [Sphingomonas sp. AR_OL41]MDH7975946.1 serine hydrolase [Sphingomonas sp. AR_OL41]
MSEMAANRREMMVGGGAALLSAAVPARASPTTQGAAGVDAIARRFLASFALPGVGIAVIRPGTTDIAAGYGIATLGQRGQVDAHTRFAIASNSKAFTAAALALLVEQGKLGWDEPVVRYLPEFRMYDPAVTQMMTVRDLLVHRSGLGLGQGDLMLFNTTHSLQEILAGLAYLKPYRGFRSGYAYDNILYLVAGMLTERVSGRTWEDFVTGHLLVPLGMRESGASRAGISGDNVAGRHARMGPPVRGMGTLKVISPGTEDKIGSAGGIMASPHDALAWLRVQLRHGALPDGRRLWSEQQQAEMWKPQIVTSSGPGPTPADPAQPVLSSYALGWNVQDYRGHRLISHGGMLDGQTTAHALLPDLGCAVAVYTNQEERLVTAGLRNALLDLAIGTTAVNWIAVTRGLIAKQEREALKAMGGAGPAAPPGGPSLRLAGYAGRYRDPWFGDAVIKVADNRLMLDLVKAPSAASVLEPWGQDAFRTRFSNGWEDAVFSFAVKDGAITEITARALSPLADFSFDYQDLRFTPVA